MTPLHIFQPHLQFALFFVTLLPMFSTALETDREQPIKIQADSAIVDETRGASVYKGSVIITQGTLEVTADEVEIFTADSEVIQIIAKANKDSGALAHYQQQTNLAMDMVVADAQKITYLVQEERLPGMPGYNRSRTFLRGSCFTTTLAAVS